MAIKQINYSCGGTSTERVILKFQLNEENSELSNFVFYSGPCDPQTGEFFPKDLKKTNIKSEKDISNHVEGIKLMLETEYEIKKPVLKFE